MKKSTVLSIFIFLLCIVLAIIMVDTNIFNWNNTPSIHENSGNIPEIDMEMSAIGSKENPQARRAYELAMVVDPETGELPQNIKRREYLYSARLPKKNGESELRKGSSHATGWRSIGPYNVGGRTRALAIDVTNENIFLAGGVSGGMWRTEDAGRNWVKTTVPSSIHSVSCIVQDTRPGKTHIWYYGSGEFTSNSASKKSAPFRGDGVFKSVDGGNTWSQLASTAEGVPNNYNSQFQYVSKLIINKNNVEQDEVFLCTVGAIFRSLNGGESWEIVLGTKLISTPDTDLNDSNISDYTDIAQAIDGSYYAVFSEQTRSTSSPNRGVFRSANGVQWSNITPVSWPRNFARTVIAPSSTENTEVYFCVDAEIDKLWKFTYVSGDGNQIRGFWDDLSFNIPAFGGDVGDYDTQSSYNMVLEVHPENGDMVYLGGTNLYRSDDGFSTSSNTYWIGGYDTANNVQILKNHYVDQHALEFFPSNPNKMLSSNDGGVYLTEDNTRPLPSWLPLNNGFVTSQFYTVGLNEFGSMGEVMGGLQDNGSQIASTPNEFSYWINLLSGDGGYSAITRNSAFYYASFQYGKIYRFTLDKNLKSKNFTRIDPYGSGGKDKLLFVNPYVLAPENQHMMYFAGGDVVWRNFNTSQIPIYKNEPANINWEIMTPAEIDHGTISAINASYNPDGIVMFGTNDGKLFRINNANQPSYSVDNITSPEFPENAYLSCITFDRRDSRKISVAYSNYNVISLFYSEDGGDTFNSISGNLEENADGSGSGPSVRWIEIVSKNDGTSSYFAGTSTGVYSTDILQGVNTTWEQEGAEEVGNVLTPMIRYFSEDGHLIAATHGNGMYATKLDDVWHTEIENANQEFSAGNPYPNPFSDQIRIPFSIPHDGVVKAEIYNDMGQLIKTLLWASHFEGDNVISWDGTNNNGSWVVRGTYICRIEFEGESIGKRIIYIP